MPSVFFITRSVRPFQVDNLDYFATYVAVFCEYYYVIKSDISGSNLTAIPTEHLEKLPDEQ